MWTTYWYLWIADKAYLAVLLVAIGAYVWWKHRKNRAPGDTN